MKTVSIWRAITAVVLSCSYTAITMYHLSKALLIKQAITYESDINAIRAHIH